MNPLKKPYEAVLKFVLEGYVEAKQVVETWIRKVHFPGKDASKNVRPSQTVFNHSFRGKLEAHLKSPDHKDNRRFDELLDAIAKNEKKKS